MANLIQIKRSQNTAVPSNLANGEFAWSSNGNILFIGAGGSIAAVAGTRTPGILTANQALVANATSGIDKIIVAGATITALTANGTVGTSGQYLTSNGSAVYWSNNNVSNFNSLSDVTISAASNNQLVVYNQPAARWENASFGNGFTFANRSPSVLAGTGLFVNASGVHINTTFVASQTANNASYLQGYTWDSPAAIGSGIANTGSFTQVAVGNVVVNTTSIMMAGDSISPTVTVRNSGIIMGNTAVTGSPIVSVSNTLGTATLSTTDLSLSNTTVTSLIANQSGIYHTGTVNASSFTTSGITADTTGVYPISNSVGSALGTNNRRWIIYSAGFNSSGSINGTAGANITGSVNVTGTVLVGSNVAINATAFAVGNSTSNTTITGTGVSVGNNTVTGSQIVSVANASGNTVLGATRFAVSNSTAVVFVANTTKLTFSGANVDFGTSTTKLGPTQINGDLSVTGTVTTVDTVNLTVTDSMIKLASGQANTTTYTDAVDIGFYGVYGNTSVTRYAGLARDSVSGQFMLFGDLLTAPGNTSITTTTPLSTLNAYLNAGGLASNSSAVTITANSSVAVNITANSLSLSTPLAAISGGTGTGVYTPGDLLVGNSGNSLTKLSLGTAGDLLQSNGTALVYGSLDGGVF